MAYLEELLPEFRKGAKIRRKDWEDSAYLVFNTKDELILNQKGSLCEFIHGDIVSNDWELYQEPVDWYYIIKNKCICWFWDEWFGAVCIGVLGEIHKECDLKFVLRDENGNHSQFRHCRPVRRDEVTFYEDRKDE